jgi:transcription termination factor Rho
MTEDSLTTAAPGDAPAKPARAAAKKTAVKKAPAKKAAAKKPRAAKDPAPPPAPQVESVAAETPPTAPAKRTRKPRVAVADSAPATVQPELPLLSAPPTAKPAAPAPAPAPPPPAVAREERPAAVPAAEAASASPPVGERPHTESSSGGEGDDNPRQRRWKERRSRFKKWKDKRRGPNGMPLSDPAAEPGAQPPEILQPPVLLGPPEPAEGILELTVKGHGFLRQKSRGYAAFAQDPHVGADLIRQFGLREGMHIAGKAAKTQRGPVVTEISEVNNRAPESIRGLPLFEELKAVNPSKRIQLETDKNRLTTRVIDMITPIGRGQRALIVAPPRTGKTTLLQHVAEAVLANHPQMHLMLLLVDERPEEVTEFKLTLPRAEIFASSNDEDIKSHTRISQFAIERAKRLVECGEHVFILLDSITRLARAFNNAKQGGATMSGGVGVGALEIPRRLFAAARNTRGAGSLTILATALIETGSRMDDLIFQEFKGTGNMELVLDRKIAEQFYYPAVNIFKSGTRREELLLQSFQLDKIHMLRRGLAGHKPIEALQRVLSLLERYPSNAQMLVDLPSKS